MVKGKDVERFWNKVNKGDGCWEWTGANRGNGYGCFKLNEKVVSAHRVAWSIENGNILDGMLILHKCHNRACVNPEHLYIGTHKDNVRDAIECGAHRSPPKNINSPVRRGAENKASKLTESCVREIRKLREGGKTYRAIADRYNVDHTTIISLIKGETWAYVV